MKKLLLIVSIFASAATFAQQNSHRHAVKINPLSLFLMTGNASYEHAIGQNQSVQLGMFYSGVSFGGLKYSGIGITPEYRFYFGGRKTAMNGVYAAPFARYQNFTLQDKETTQKTSFTSFGGGATIGWERAWDSGFLLDLFIGPAYNKGKFKNDSDEDQFDISGGVNGFGVRTGLTLGFAF
jgi:hypothetical protein